MIREQKHRFSFQTGQEDGFAGLLCAEMQNLFWDEELRLNDLAEISLICFQSGAGKIQNFSCNFEYKNNGILFLPKQTDLLLIPNIESEAWLFSLENAKLFLQNLRRDESPKYFQAEHRENYRLQKFLLHGKAQGETNLFQLSADLYQFLMSLETLAYQEKAPYNKLVREAIETIENDYFFLSGIDELADELEVSKAHLIRLFKSDTGVTPGRYLQKLRIDNAKLLLANRDYGLETVANMVGYSGANYFCKVFVRETGESPGQYRKRASISYNEREKEKLAQIENIYQL